MWYYRRWNSESSSSEAYNSDTDKDESIPSSKPLSRCRMKPNLRARVVQKQKKQPSRRKRFSSSDDESTGESEEETVKSRLKARRGATVSYKEDSEEKTDSDDVVEVDYGESQEAAAAEASDTAETIEKVIAQRRGKKGGRFSFDEKIMEILF